MSVDNFASRPDYEGKCITNIPGTLRSLFGEDYERSLLDGKAKKVLLILVDSLGYENLMKIIENDEGLSKFVDKFELQKISSVFPSSTAPAIASIESGKSPEEHSLFSWMIYSKKLNMRFYPLGFEPVDEKEDYKFEKKADKSLVEHESIFTETAELGVEIYRINPDWIVGNEFSEVEKSSNEGYSNLVEAFVKTRKLIAEEENRSFFYLYLPHFDTSDHNNGPYSEESKSLIKEIFRLIKDEIVEKLENLEIIITADHGCLEIENRIEITKENELGKEIFPNLKTCNGKKILPSGEPRNLFLHIKEENLEEVVKSLRKRLKDEARIFKTDLLIEEDLFGSGEPSQRFLEDVGNVSILPERNAVIHFDPYLGKEVKGMHGGLTEEELYVPFLSKKI